MTCLAAHHHHHAFGGLWGGTWVVLAALFLFIYPFIRSGKE